MCQWCFYHQSIIYYTFIKSIQVSINLLDTIEIHNIHTISMHMSQWQRIHKYNMRNVNKKFKINTIISQLILSMKSWHTMGCTTLSKNNLLDLPPCVLWHQPHCSVGRYMPSVATWPTPMDWGVSYSEKIFICKTKWGLNPAILDRNLKIVTKYFSSTICC